MQRCPPAHRPACRLFRLLADVVEAAGFWCVTSATAPREISLYKVEKGVGISLLLLLLLLLVSRLVFSRKKKGPILYPFVCKSN
jgi:hypothetical protein